MNLLEKIYKEELNNLKIKYNTNFKSGDIISLNILIDKKKNRFKNFTGLIISKKNNNINSTFTIIKKINSFLIEKNFFIYSPNIKNIQKISNIKKRKSKLYYLKK